MKHCITKKRKVNNKGMSIVTVIVAIGFVAILVSTIMLSSVVNFKMKSVNVYAKDSFYSAEQVLDEINVGLQQVVSDGLSYSYKQVMQTYNAEELTSDEKSALIKGEYYNYIWNALGVSSDPEKYYVVMPTDVHDDSLPQGLYGLLKESTKWNDTSSDPEGYYGAFLRAGSYSADGAYLGKITSYDKKGIVLEDLTVYYKDPNGFVSAIRTDIRLGYPEFAFSNNDIPTIATYAFITDTLYEQKYENVTKSGAGITSITGNTYAYAVDTKGVKFDYLQLEDDLDMHIVATDYAVANGAIQTNANSILWAGDINIKSSDVNLTGQTYVQDDLSISGKNSDVILRGYYTGFGNSVTDSSASSAILVNGTDTSIDLTGVRKLSLAGRAYIGMGNTARYSSNIGSIIEGRDDPHSVYTGESIAVKSNQLMYLVPAECIGCSLTITAEGTTEGNSIYGKNPLTVAEYNDLMAQVSSGDAIEVSVSKKINKLGNIPLGGYIATKADGKADVEKLFLRTSSGSNLVYYYMKFASEDLANEYFKTYYSANKAAVDQYMSKYLKSLTIPTTGVLSLKIDMAAAAVEGNAALAESGTTSSYNVVDGVTRQGVRNGDTLVQDISEQFTDDTESLTSQFIGYISKLTPDVDALPSGTIIRTSMTDEDTRYAVFDNIIEEDMLKDMTGSGTLELTDGTGDDKVTALLIYRSTVDAEYTVSDPDKYDLIVANCGVILGGNKFKGSIIAKGKIEAPSGNYSFETDSDKVQDCLGLMTDDGVYSVADVFKDADSSSFMAIADGTDSEVTAATLVTYENWTKSVDIE